MGVFLGDIFKAAGLAPSFLSYVIGAVVCCVWAGWIVYRGITLSTKGALAFLIFEIFMIFAMHHYFPQY